MNINPPNKTKELSQTEQLDWLRLIRSENVGPITFYKLLERFGTAKNALKAIPDLAKKGGKRQIKVCTPSRAEDELEKLTGLGGRLICRGEPDYPPLLAQIEDAPPVISVLGHASLLTKATVGIVGARNASVNGRNFARKLACDLGAGGLMVVSGMARGIDTCAHEGAMDSGTAAILGGGIDVIYPKENAPLYEELKHRGVIVSEVPIGTQPQARHFPRRNRLISGISRGILVVEANPRSGSLITARMALEQNREVFAIPGSPLDPRAQGTNTLIQQGANLVQSADDILKNLKEAWRMPLTESEPLDFKGNIPDQPSDQEIDSARSVIEESLDSAPIPIDEIIRNCLFPPAVVSTILLEMELAGRLERHPGGRVSLIRECI